MSAALSVFVFQCAATDLHVLTLYRSGNNISSGDCPKRWIYRGRLLLTRQSLGTLPIDTHTAMSALQQHGIYMVRLSSGIIILRP
jgi:hypothetical protein